MAYSTIDYSLNGRVYLSELALDAFIEIAASIEAAIAKEIKAQYPLPKQKLKESYNYKRQREIASVAKTSWNVVLKDGRKLRDLTTEELYRLPNSRSQAISELSMKSGYQPYSGGVELSLRFGVSWGNGHISGSITGNDDAVVAANVKIMQATEFAIPNLPALLRWKSQFWFKALLVIAWLIIFPPILLEISGTKTIVPDWAHPYWSVTALCWMFLFAASNIWGLFYPPFDCAIGDGKERVKRIEQRRGNVVYSVVLPIVFAVVTLIVGLFLTMHFAP